MGQVIAEPTVATARCASRAFWLLSTKDDERLRPVDVFDDAGLASSGAARRGRRVMDVRPAQ